MSDLSDPVAPFSPDSLDPDEWTCFMMAFLGLPETYRRRLHECLTALTDQANLEISDPDGGWLKDE
jgi:hypothetical protein